MDLITFLNVAASVATLIALGLEIYSIFSKNSSNNQAQSITNTNVTISPDYSTTYIVDSGADKKSKNTNNTSTGTSDDIIGFMVLFIIVGGLISKLYLDYQPKIMLYIIATGIICLGADLFCLLLLAKRNLINNFTLCVKTIRWLPLFIVLIFIYHPLYNSDSLLKVEQLIKTGTGYFNIFATYTYDVAFLLIQITGLALIMAFFVIFLGADIKGAYKGLKYNVLTRNASINDYIGYFIGVAFMFTMVSGLYVSFWHYISSLAK